MSDDTTQMIADLEARESKLTDWERGFIDSISKQAETRPLSEKQREILERIWDRVT